MQKINQLIYALVKSVPFGRVTTFVEVARAVGQMVSPSTVRGALNKIDIPPDVPYHRVVRKNGSLFLGRKMGGLKEQKHKLEYEGVEVKHFKVDLKKYGFYFW